MIIYVLITDSYNHEETKKSEFDSFMRIRLKVLLQFNDCNNTTKKEVEKMVRDIRNRLNTSPTENGYALPKDNEFICQGLLVTNEEASLFKMEFTNVKQTEFKYTESQTKMRFKRIPNVFFI